jgi:protein gp37
MSQASNIEWTDATWNPVRGCSRVSDGCQRCYAEGIARRFSGPGKPYEGLIHSSGRWNGKIHLAEDHLLDPIRWSKGRRIFVNSMSDLFHEAIPFEYIDKVFAVMACTTRHTYQVLTKRPQRMLEYFARLRWNASPAEEDEGTTYEEQVRWFGGPHGLAGHPDQVQPSVVYDEWRPWRENERHGGYDNCGPLWPLTNVWLGVSCENQATADERIPLLLKVPVAIRFLSCEPLLGPIDLTSVRHSLGRESYEIASVLEADDGFGLNASRNKIDWCIVGGESGHGARPMEVEWARSLKIQCAAAGTSFFMKQGSQANWPDFKNFSNFPPSLQVREWPVRQ